MSEDVSINKFFDEAMVVELAQQAADIFINKLCEFQCGWCLFGRGPLLKHSFLLGNFYPFLDIR
jgi:hypothetical protein